MIDFPASPTTGQIFNGTNGVTYMWTGTIWVATASTSASAGGDFSATRGNQTVNPTNTIINGFTVSAGNSGNWLNVATGRFTPPAGRYYIFAGYSFVSSSSVLIGGIVILKNGVSSSAFMTATSPAANNQGECSVAVTVDANGTDYFELACQGHVAAVSNTFFFGAYPISGIKGPQGDPGTFGTGFRLLQRTDVAAPVTTVQVQNVPTDINDLMFTFELVPATNDVALVLQFYDNVGAIDSTTAHYKYAMTQAIDTAAGGSAPAVFSSTSTTITTGILLTTNSATGMVSSARGIRGNGTVPNIKASEIKGVNFQSVYLDGGATIFRIMTGSGMRNFVGAITGIRLGFSTGNIASGSFSVWGSP